ncbi:MFS transporter [Streptomyces sp. NPDC021212]|uniref:MFS transporter n=1 Tax=Streptomyces sp. NPDC021212 TaxID=3365118 RepID=UPI0037AB8A13
MLSARKPGAATPHTPESPHTPVPPHGPERIAKATGQEVNGVFIALFILAYIGLWIALCTPASVTLSLRVADLDPAGKSDSLSTIAGAGAFCALVANPVFGRLSDLSTSRWGRRRPYILGGMVLGFGALLVMGTAPNLFVLGLGWCLAQVLFNAALAAATALLPERVTDRYRGRVSGLMGTTTQIGIVSGTFLVQFTGTDNLWMFLAPGLLGLAMTLVFVCYLKELPRSRAELPRLRWADIPSSMWINPVRHRDFARAWCGRFLTWTGVSFLTTYKAYFLMDRLGYTAEDATPILFWSMLLLATTTTLSSYTAGWLSDRLHRRKVFVAAASVVFACAMVVVALAQSTEMFLVGVGLSGLGQGMYMGVDYALVASVLPNKETEAAKGMGVFNLSSTIPQTIAPILAPVFLALGGDGNYAALYAAAAAFSIAGAFAIRLVRGAR